MPKCEKCNTQTDTMYFNLCEKCHAFSVFDQNKPTNEVIERVKSNICIPCGNNFLYPMQHKANCGYCQLVKKYYSDYQKQMDIKAQDLPPIDVIVKAKCKRIDGTIEEHFIKRIHSKETSKGWHWSNSEIKTYFTLEVISFEYI